MTYLLIHGGGSSARYWDRLVPLLDGPALAVNLPGRLGQPGDLETLSLDQEAASVVADVEAASLAGPITIVAHSSGGLVVPRVVAGLAAAGIGVDRIVLNAALVPEEGGRGLDCMKPHHRDGLVWAVDEAAKTGTHVTMPGAPEDPEPFRGAYGGEPLSDEDLAYVAHPERTVADTVHHYFQPVHWSQAAGIPVTYIVNARDRPVAPDNQRAMAGRIADLAHTIEMDGGHLPAVTDVEAFAAAVARDTLR